jgi:hypothetical protein
MKPTPSLAQTNAPRHLGPSLATVGIVFVVLFVASLVVSTAMAGGAHFPSPFDPESLSARYFVGHASAVRVGAFLQFCATIPLGIFTATAVSRLRFLGVQAAGATIALFGGLMASVLLASSAFAQWVLSQPGVLDSVVAVRALHLLAFATGGPGFVAPFGLLVAGVSVSAGIPRWIPRWLMMFGLVVAAVAELSTLALVAPAAAYLLPLARFPGFVWIVCAGVLLPRSRRKSGI